MRRKAILIALLLMLSLSAVSCAESEAVTQSKDHLGSAAALVDKGDWAGAISEYDQAIALNPKSDIAYEGRGVAETNLGDFDRAIADLSKAIELAPDRGGPYFDRGVAYRQQGELDKAVADLSHAIGNRSTTRWRGALYERGLAYKAKGNIAEARADFERIVQLEQERPGEADKEWVDKARKELATLGQ